MGYPIVEIFDSIQGEGSWLGRPVTFIRMGGCNLHCPWCDTDFSKFKDMSIVDICHHVSNRDIVITGGEPLIHDLVPLLQALRNANGFAHSIAIETNGTRPTVDIEGLVQWIVVSPKPEVDYKLHPDCHPSELKYVVDGTFKPSMIPDTLWQKYAGRIWLQPEGGDMQKRWKEAFDYTMQYPGLRVGVQLHKLMEVK